MKGISLISLVITIVCIIIISSIIIYHAYNKFEIEKLNKINLNIENLSGKINLYYLKNQKLPLILESGKEVKLNIDIVKELIGEKRASEDDDNYYIIDITYLDNLTYERISNNEAYIINEKTHNIYYISCNEKEHAYVILETIGTTCTDNGIMRKKCICGFFIEEIIPALGHDFQGATCTENGVCTRCGAVLDALGHDFPNEYNKHDETHHWKQCTRCDETTEHLIHNKEWGYNDSEHFEQCTDCSWIGSKFNHQIAYTYNDENHTEQCNVCNWVGQPESHQYSFSTTTATCTQNGVKKGTCTCGHTTSETVQALGHNYQYWKSTSGTCINKGLNYYKCTRCDNSYSVEGEYGTHSYNLYSSTSATCTSGGKQVYRCSYCSDTYTTITSSALGHNYVYSYSTSGTCTSPGRYYYTCTRCSSSYSTQGSYGSHSYYQYSSTAGTCTTPSTTTYRCSYCGSTYTNTGTVTGHRTSSTWSTNSSSHWKVCTVCGITTVPAVSHTKSSTWSHTGGMHNYDYHYKPCTVCGYELDKGYHTKRTWKKVNRYHHQATCAKCGAKSFLRSHNKSGDHCGSCGASGSNIVYNHYKKDPSCGCLSSTGDG